MQVYISIGYRSSSNAGAFFAELRFIMKDAIYSRCNSTTKATVFLLALEVLRQRDHPLPKC